MTTKRIQGMSLCDAEFFNFYTNSVISFILLKYFSEILYVLVGL